MLLALGFVLARNVIKLVVERRRGLPFSRFRAQAGARAARPDHRAVGARAARRQRADPRSTQRAGSASRSTTSSTSANAIAGDLLSRSRGRGRARRRRGSRGRAGGGARGGRPRRAAGGGRGGRSRTAASAWSRSIAALPSGETEVVPLVALSRRRCRAGHLRASSDRLAAQVAAGSSDTQAHEPLDGGGELVRAGAIITRRRRQPVGRRHRERSPVGRPRRKHARSIAEAYEDYSQLRVLKRPLEGRVPLAVPDDDADDPRQRHVDWASISPSGSRGRCSMLAAGAREIGAGHLDHRIEPETRDEFGSLVEAFNSMAGELATSQRQLERSRVEMERKNSAARRAPPLHRDGARAHRHRRRVDRRRRPRRDHQQRRAAAARRRPRASSASRGRRGASAARICGRSPRCCSVTAAAGQAGPAAQEIALAREGREIHLAAAATPLQGEDGAHEGTVLVFDDVTPLVRTQRVAAWRDVARRLAHEIKNPLTPIQLSAERMRRHFGGARRRPARSSTSARRRSSARSNR